RHVETGTRHRANGLAGLGWLEVELELLHGAREVVGRGVVAAEGPGRDHVGARGPAEAEIDTAGVQRGQRAELLGNDERRVVGQHDAARPDANRRGAGRHVGDDDGRGGTGDARHVVVLGQPEAAVAERLGALRQLQRMPERVGRGEALTDGAEVENRKRYSHGPPSGAAAYVRWQEYRPRRLAALQ